MIVENHTLASSTSYATPYYVIRGEYPGPVVMVVSGIHGNEIGSVRAAQRIVDRFKQGRLYIYRGTVITTKRAYEELEREGLINSIVGKGSFVSGADQEFIREQRLRIMENKMKEIIDESKLLGIDFAEFTEMLKLLYEEETE